MQLKFYIMAKPQHFCKVSAYLFENIHHKISIFLVNYRIREADMQILIA